MVDYHKRSGDLWVKEQEIEFFSASHGCMDCTISTVRLARTKDHDYQKETGNANISNLLFWNGTNDMELKGNVFTSTYRLLKTKTAITSHSLHLIYRNILKLRSILPFCLVTVPNKTMCLIVRISLVILSSRTDTSEFLLMVWCHFKLRSKRNKLLWFDQISIPIECKKVIIN